MVQFETIAKISWKIFFNTHLFKKNPHPSAETHYFKSTNIGVEIEYTTVEYEKCFCLGQSDSVVEACVASVQIEYALVTKSDRDEALNALMLPWRKAVWGEWVETVQVRKRQGSEIDSVEKTR